MHQHFTLQPSKYYFLLSISAYLLAIITNIIWVPAWIGLWIVLFLLFTAKLHLSRIKQFSDKDIIAFDFNEFNLQLYYGGGKQVSQTHQTPSFISNICIIVPLLYDKTQSLVIFKDSLHNAKITQLRKLFTIYKPND